MKRPNFLFIITDQHRADYLGCAGHRIVKTPNIDAITANGTMFDRFHVAAPVCMPNRASLLTGRFPSAHGLRYNGCELSYRAATFTEVLKLGGYHTASIGKSHVQPMTEFAAEQRVDPAALGLLQEAWHDDGEDYDHETPGRYSGNSPYQIKLPYYGYDHVDMVTGHGQDCNGHYLQWLRAKSPMADAWRDRVNQLPHNYVCPQAVRTPIPEELYPTSFVRDKAVQFIDDSAKDERPFFAFVSFPDPHHPFTPPGRYWDMYDPADFSVRLPYEAHHNPTPPMRWLHERWREGKRVSGGQEAFMADERELREAMALSCGMITMLDDAVGEIVSALKRSGQYENTVIVFNADHGDYLGDYNLLLKGGIMLRSITNVPFIWSDPEDRTSRRSHTLASTIDLAPSIIERAGLKPYFGIQGESFLGALQGAGAMRDRLMIEHQDNVARMGFSKPCMARTLLTDTHRLTIYQGENWGELYDLQSDFDESRNLWDDRDHAAIRASMIEALAQEMMRNVDQSPRARRRA
ncbi:MAG: sulfatase-like hydrolase/transferase [Beijerinckiaceae bacterium]|nr:sulfatase-like hydrolase/transferase [Beijerinckiaceae bacterium]